MATANLMALVKKLHPQKRRWHFAAAATLFCLVAGIAIGEWLGWPFLAAPLQRTLSEKLNRQVSFAASADQSTSSPASFRMRFIGGVHVSTSHLYIAAPAWSKAPHLLNANDVVLDLRYVDLLRAYRGGPLRINRLKAGVLDGNLQRLADRRATWQFGLTPPPAPKTEADGPLPIPRFGHLQITKGTIKYRDVPLTIDIEAQLSLVNGASVMKMRTTSSGNIAARGDGKSSNGKSGEVGSVDAKSAEIKSGDKSSGGSSSSSSSTSANLLRANARGHYRGLPLTIEMVSSGVLPWVSDGGQAAAVPLSLNATIGRANLVFDGTAVDMLHLTQFTGQYTLKGPSLAAVGDLLGVTLPTTDPFRTKGTIVRQKDTWRVVVDDATVGASQLTGAFTYEAGRSVPLLTGRLGGSRLLLTDLGPVVGSTTATTAAAAMTDGVSKPLPKSTKGRGMVLPDRPFDLAALRAMDANVLIDIAEVDLNSKILQPLRPLNAHLQLAGGVLTLTDIEARTAQGRLNGGWSLDGRGSQALWNADLRWDGVRLEKWIRQTRTGNAPPYVTGSLSGKTTLKGQGRSTAEILASLKGQLRADLREGTVSHLLIEAGGLDIAQGLGLLVKGDDVLPVQCAAADLTVDGGLFRPRVMVIDTSDSTVWVDGSLSLATEAIDLRMVVVPKDFSPLTLRTPVLVRGTFSEPKISVEKGPLGRKLGSAFLLGLLNPLAALIPFIDTGGSTAANKGSAGCAGLVQRGKAKFPVAVAPTR